MPFSVLMSLYAKERPDYLRQSLDSVFCQTVKADEVVLVEDGPVGEALESVVREYCDRYPDEMKIIPIPINGGLGKALNEGLKHCSHELVARMDTDDICFPDRFEKQLSFMTENSQVDICSGWLEEFEGDTSNIIAIKKVPEEHKEIVKYIKFRNPLNHPAVIFRKDAVLKAGNYQHFPLFEDYYLWARMMVSGAIFANIPTPIVHFRTSTDMYKRRGGFKYAKNSVKFQWKLHRLGLVSTIDAIKSSLIRGVVYMMPNDIRALLYSHLLRNN